MKGIKENLPSGRKASNARMNEACNLLTRHIMSDTRVARWLSRFKEASLERQAAKLRRTRVKKVIAGRGWFRVLMRKLSWRI